MYSWRIVLAEMENPLKRNMMKQEAHQPGQGDTQSLSFFFNFNETSQKSKSKKKDRGNMVEESFIVAMVVAHGPYPTFMRLPSSVSEGTVPSAWNKQVAKTFFAIRLRIR